MGVKYLWDTNTAIYYLQQQFPPAVEKLVDQIFSEVRPCISIITEIELLCWRIASEKDIYALNNFIDYSVVINLENAVKLKTVDIRKQYKIKLPDAVIAATAIVYDLVLLTHNTKDFNLIEGIKMIDPWATNFSANPGENFV